MQLAVKNFAKSKEKGLCLIDMPTGTGKTYEARQLIRKFILGQELQNLKRIIYLTPLKKNLDEVYDELKKELSNDELFDNNVLRLYSNLESVQEFLLKNDSTIPPAIKNKDSYKMLYSSIKTINNNRTDKEIKDSLINSIGTDFEFKFRSDLKKEIFKNSRSVKERMGIINNDYPWVKKMYPSCLIDNRKVLFMTMDKFLYPNDPIIKDSYSFNDKKFLENTLIFIDEFDSTKDKILNKEIKECTNYKIDIAMFYRCLIDSINSRKIPEDAFADNEVSRNSFSEMVKKANELKDEFHLDLIFKLKTGEDVQNYFLFDDFRIHTIHSEDDNKPISIKTDNKKRQNIISFGNADNSESFYLMINKMTSFINYFVKCCYILSVNYMNKYNDNPHSIDKMTMDEASFTIVDYFGFDERLKERIVSLIIGESFFATKKKSIGCSDFYMNGFKFYDFEDHISHDMSTKISTVYLNCTPEKYLINLCNNAKVVGLSATATIDTVTGNFDLKYIKKILKNDFYNISKEEQNEINNLVFSKLSTEYPINFERVSVISESLKTIVEPLFKSEIMKEKYVSRFERYVRNSEKNPYYDIERFVKILKSVELFISNPESKVLLSLTNKNVGEDEKIFNKTLIKDLIADISSDLGIEDIPKCCYLFGDNFDAEKKRYVEEVRSGSKVIIFSSYNSIGTGQNLQYTINENGEKVQKDIDSLYLERPTHIIVHQDSFYNDESLTKYIYQLEALRVSNNINPFLAIQCIKSAFKKRLGEKSDYIQSSTYDCRSTNNHLLIKLVQAVGRICRTKNKNANHLVSLYIDNEITDKIDFSIMKNRLINPEFKKICDSSNYINNSYTQTNKNLYEAINNNMELEKLIRSLLSHNKLYWDEDDMKQWKKVRNVLLKHPTISYNELNELSKIDGLENIGDFYLKSCDGVLIYSYIFNKKSKSIYYITDDYKKSSGDTKIDVYNCRLKHLLSNQIVYSYFVEKGYATEFKKNDCILLPYVYHSIYKGALGEIAGKIIFEKVLGIELDEITDPYKFEKFDYCCHDNKDVYIDFKNWDDNDKQDRDECIKHSLGKLISIDGFKAFIVNMISSNEFKIHQNNDKNIIEIPSIYNWKNNYFESKSDLKQIKKYLMEAIGYGNQ